MNTLKRIVVALLVATMTIGVASARFGIGPKIGMNVNQLKFNQEILDGSNRVGFNGGIMIDFTVPIIGIGFDLSVMYVHRGESIVGEKHENLEFKGKNDYFEIPLNFKYKLGLPIPVLQPFIITGPSVAFRTGKENFENAIKYKSVDWAWNVGAGVEILNHVQIAASYGFGLTKAMQFIKPSLAGEGAGIEGKNRYWTVTAAYLF